MKSICLCCANGRAGFDCCNKPRLRGFIDSMKRLVAILLLLVCGCSFGSETTFLVDGVQRTAIVYAASNKSGTAASPVVFVFHGHGGTARYSSRRLAIHKYWPEAVVVYMGGLPGVAGGKIDPEGRLPGWQMIPGQLGDRDVKFFDVALRQVSREYSIDQSRVYVMGHSNGGRFVNVLWKMRPEKIAAICAAAGPGGLFLAGADPRPIYMIAGENDPIVPFRLQSVAMEGVRMLLKTESSRSSTNGYETTEPGIHGTELVTYIHPGGHEFPQDALPLIVQFFKRHSLKD